MDEKDKIMPSESYDALLEQCRRLKEENEHLKALLEAHKIPLEGKEKRARAEEAVPRQTEERSLPDCRKGLSKHSSLSEKIQLYMSLFHGREDVYAKRWESPKTGKKGYSPACRNEWIPGICSKPCGKCTHASYYPYTEEAVRRHLAKDNSEVLGIYAIQPDDTCWFLAIDLDEAEWKNDVRSLWKVCLEMELPCAVEKSRSGEGAHVWFFFSERIPAFLARKMGTSVITLAMKRNARLSFASYDRMFPNQDTMPEGGFGNLIALPLQPEAARKCGGSLFIDELGEAYPDQWAYLSTLRRMSLVDVEAAVSKMRLEIGEGSLGKLAEEEEEKPWKRKKEDGISAEDPTKEFECVISDRIYINTERISNSVLNCVKRLAAFRNPEFYKKQARRLRIAETTPRIICCAEYDGSYLCMPRGMADEINAFAKENGIRVQWKNEQCRGRSIDVAFRGELYTEQQIAFEILRQFDKGVLSATTAFGKTVIGAALIAEKKTTALILVHRKQLLEQWKERLEHFLDIRETVPQQPKRRGKRIERTPIGVYGNGKDARSGIIDIAMMQSIEKKKEVPAWIGEYGLVIVDECHHVPAASFEAILKEIRAEYTYGLTATPKRRDGRHPLIPMYLGPIRYRVNAKEQAALRPFSHIMVPRFTGMIFGTEPEGEAGGIAWYYSRIAEDDLRNHMIVDDVLSCVEEGRNCLVLSERVLHVQKLSELIREKYSEVFILVGGQSPAEGKNQLHKVHDAPHDKPIVVCATGKYIGEGFDESRLDTLFLTMPISWEGILAQYAGRLHRLYQGKREVRVYDYIDDQAIMLERMYNKRLHTYASLGYEVCGEQSDAYVHRDIIYDQRTFVEPFLQDIREARRSIVIVSPFIKESRVNWLYNTVQMNAHPLKVTIITRPSESFHSPSCMEVQRAIARLKEVHADVVCKNAIHQKFAVIDNKIVWYGSINLLSFGASQESIIRIVTGSVAKTLIESALSKK